MTISVHVSRRDQELLRNLIWNVLTMLSQFKSVVIRHSFLMNSDHISSIAAYLPYRSIRMSTSLWYIPDDLVLASYQPGGKLRE